MKGRRRAPRATYRLQLRREFPLGAARAVVPYLARLGVSHAYASPLLRARAGSAHGYDGVDPTRLSPDLGGEAALRALVRALHRRRMGLVLDIVPNHLAIGGDNPAWTDVLAHGRASRFAPWFDVDWDAAGGRVVLPVLGRPLARALAAGEIGLGWTGRAVVARYFEHAFPLAPATWRPLVPRGPLARGRVEAALRRFAAGRAGRRRLAGLLGRQHYRLVHWRRAAREVNYRRFFDVNELIGLRQEDPAVFAATHARVLGWVRAGLVDALRIDHVDGLRDPEAYLRRLWTASGSVPLWVEKILCGDETLPPLWPVEGTTGYEFLGTADALFVDAAGFARIAAWYRRRVWRGAGDFHAAAAAGKRRALDDLLWADVRRVARLLARLPAARRAGLARLHEAAAELMVGLPVYRTYASARAPALGAADRAYLRAALAVARRRRRAPAGALARVVRVLGAGAGAARLEAVARFQQTSGPAAAKGVEDTALYAWVPLASRNDVGTDPGAPLARAVETFHAANADRAARWPRTLLCTTTHDTKRTADVRARLHVLSEMPAEWTAAVARWRRWNHVHRRRAGPDPNTEYLFYQTVVGVWPLPAPGRRPDAPPGAGALRDLGARVEAYMTKAAREAKRHTSWLRPAADFESALAAFVRAALRDPGSPFLRDLARFVAGVARPGLWTALARTLLHLTAPGVPDLYQGDETWTFALVDPDNRRPVDFARRAAMLRGLEARRGPRAALVGELLAAAEDGRVKLDLVRRVLAARRRAPDLFTVGRYQRLRVTGPRARHVVAFARRHRGRTAVIAVPRLVYALVGPGGGPPVGRALWAGTALRLRGALRGARLRCALGGQVLRPVRTRGGAAVLPVGAVFAAFPGALLCS